MAQHNPDVPINKRKEYTNFRANVPLRKVVVGRESKEWSYYEIGEQGQPVLVMVHGTCAMADIYFYQMMSVGSKGFRVISAQFPDYWTHDEWVFGFNLFLQEIGVRRIHLFGASLGGFLCLHYVQRYPENVRSLVLCNAFVDTSPFADNAPCLAMFAYMPEFYLKKYILESFPTHAMPANIADAVDFAVFQLERLSRTDLGSRLTLNCIRSVIKHLSFDQQKITLIDSMDEVVLPQLMRQQLYEVLSEARRGFIKEGGDFPFLSCPDEVSLHLTVHLRRHAADQLQETKKPADEVKASDNQAAKASQEMTSTDVPSPASSGATPFLKRTAKDAEKERKLTHDDDDSGDTSNNAQASAAQEEDAAQQAAFEAAAKEEAARRAEVQRLAEEERQRQVEEEAARVQQKVEEAAKQAALEEELQRKQAALLADLGVAQDDKGSLFDDDPSPADSSAPKDEEQAADTDSEHKDKPVEPTSAPSEDVVSSANTPSSAAAPADPSEDPAVDAADAAQDAVDVASADVAADTGDAQPTDNVPDSTAFAGPTSADSKDADAGTTASSAAGQTDQAAAGSDRKTSGKGKRKKRKKKRK